MLSTDEAKLETQSKNGPTSMQSLLTQKCTETDSLLTTSSRNNSSIF